MPENPGPKEPFTIAGIDDTVTSTDVRSTPAPTSVTLNEMLVACDALDDDGAGNASDIAGGTLSRSSIPVNIFAKYHRIYQLLSLGAIGAGRTRIAGSGLGIPAMAGGSWGAPTAS